MALAKEKYNKLGKRIQELRSEKGMSLRELARRVGMSSTYLSQIERGDYLTPAEDKVRAIAAELNHDPHELLMLSDQVKVLIANSIPSFSQERALKFWRLLLRLNKKELNRLMKQLEEMDKES